MKTIATADWHLRFDKPRCRLDEDWLATQFVQLDFIAQLSRARHLPVAIFGDLLDTPLVSDRIKSLFFTFAANAESTALMPGNHDLPYHSMDNVMDSSFGVIWSVAATPCSSERLWSMDRYFDWLPFGRGKIVQAEDSGKVLCLHQLTFPTAKELPQFSEGTTAEELLAKYPSYKWIFTGDMHRSFHYVKKGRHVINPGCLNRQDASLKDYRPSVYIVDFDTEEVEQVFIPDPVSMVTDEYLTEATEREDRIAAFVEKIGSTEGLTLDFVGNVRRAIETSETLSPDVERIIEETMAAAAASK